MRAESAIDLVLVHGLFSSPSTWLKLEALLVQDQDLKSQIRVHKFGYSSPFLRIRPDRRVAEIDDIADRLGTFLSRELSGAQNLMLVTHSQGGLVAQRYLARALRDHKGQELSRIKRITMFACPNTGSDFLLSVRKLAFLWMNAQERNLRMAIRPVMEAQQVVLRSIVNATDNSATECRIPISTYGGLDDNIVRAETATWVFPERGVVDGDHFSIIQPKNVGSATYRVIKKDILEALAAVEAPQLPTTPAALRLSSQDGRDLPPPALPANSGPIEPDIPDSGGDRSWRVSVAPPLGRLGNDPTFGRDGLIAGILASSSSTNVHVLAGLGGSGKSRTALEIARRAQSEGKQVWWVSVTRINSCMREIANQLGAPEAQVDRAWHGAGSATDLVWRFLDSSPRHWVLIFDNADDPQKLASLDSPVSDGTGWLRKPTTPNGMVIVTTRDRNETTWGSWCYVHNVLPLDSEDGAAVLMKRAGREAGTFEDAKQLSEVLGGLPLALLRAADYVSTVRNSKFHHSPSGIEDFRSYHGALRARFGTASAGTGPELSELLGREIVEEVCDLALKLLVDKGLTQAPLLLKLFACMSLAPIPYRPVLIDAVMAESSLFSSFAAQQRPTVLEALGDLGLIEPHVQASAETSELSHVLSLHPLVQGILRNDDDVKLRGAEYYGLIVRMLLAATTGHDPDRPESWALWDAVAPHSIEVVRAALLGSVNSLSLKLTIAALELARLTCRYLTITGLLGPASDLIEPLIASADRFHFRQDAREILALRHEKARIAVERGQPKAAEDELRLVIAERTGLLGENDADTLASRHKLARAILEQGRWSEAEPLLRSIVEAENQVRGPLHSDTMVVRHSLARSILAQRRAVEAEAMARDILAVWPAPDPENLFVRQTLARCLLEQDRPIEAADVIVQALSDAKAHPSAPEVLMLRWVQAQALLMQGLVNDAITNLRRLKTDAQRVFGANHPSAEKIARLLDDAEAIK